MSYVYVFDFGDMVKVGYTKDLKTRLTSIQCQLKKKACDTFSILATKDIEAKAHDRLAQYRINGEFYNCTFKNACEVVSVLAAAQKCQPRIVEVTSGKFTMVLDKDVARKLDYIADYYGRSRIKEIQWACREYIAAFEKENGPIEPEEDAR